MASSALPSILHLAPGTVPRAGAPVLLALPLRARPVKKAPSWNVAARRTRRAQGEGPLRLWGGEVMLAAGRDLGFR